MVGYISKYLSYTQSCVGCIGRLVYSSETSLWGSPEYTEGSMRHWINVGLGVCWRLPKRDVTEAYHKDIWFGCGHECSIRIAKFFWLSLWHREQAGWRRRRREFGATISMDYRELTTQSIILSFYTLRLPFTAQELRRDCSSIDMWKREWVWGDRV